MKLLKCLTYHAGPTIHPKRTGVLPLPPTKSNINLIGISWAALNPKFAKHKRAAPQRNWFERATWKRTCSKFLIRCHQYQKNGTSHPNMQYPIQPNQEFVRWQFGATLPVYVVALQKASCENWKKCLICYVWHNSAFVSFLHFPEFQNVKVCRAARRSRAWKKTLGTKQTAGPNILQWKPWPVYIGTVRVQLQNQ